MARTPFRLFLPVFLAFALTAAVGGYLVHLNEKNRVLQEQKAAMHVAAMHAHLLEEQVSRSLSATYALAAVVRQGRGEVDNFDALAAEMLRLYGGTSALQLAPKGIISRIVPLAGNEAALGHALLQDPARNKEAFVAVETKKLTLAGPFSLRQGGVAVVGRLPIFLPDGEGYEAFWGFSTAVIRIPDLLAAAKLDEGSLSGYEYELSRIHPDTRQPDVFAASSPAALADPVSYQVQVPNGTWTLSIARPEGWHSPVHVLAGEAAIVLLVGLLVALLAYNAVKLPLVLGREVELRTRDLRAANDELASEVGRRQVAEESLRQRASEIEVVLGGLSDGVIAVDRRGRVRHANGAARSLLAVTGEPLQGQSLERLLAVVDEVSGEEIPGICRSVIREGNSIHLRGNVRIRTADAREFDARISALPAPESGEVAMIFVFTDISTEIRKERHIEFQAFHDPLTQLGNRALLARDLAREIEAASARGERVAVLCLDLDNFKNINDALGHTIGDVMLQQLAQRLRSVVAAPGWVTRHGGDEFIIVVPRLAAVEAATALAGELMASIARPFCIDDKVLRVTSSIGISIYPDHGASLGELVSNADMAMFEAKRHGRNSSCFYESAQLERSAGRLLLENGLRTALADDELSLVFQPKVRIADGETAAVEALLRWNSRHAGCVSPDSFIPVAEDMGLIIDIGDWVLHQAVAAARRLRSRLGRDIAVAVNVSPVQFRSERLIAALRRLAEEEPDLPRLLEIELTEQALAGDVDDVIASLRSIRDLGIRVAIDDFGTGYSSLAYLRHFPIDVLKIDQAFIRELHMNPQDQAIVGSVVQLGKSLGFDIVAEGVEESGHVDILSELGCDYAQGHWFSRPLAEHELVARFQDAQALSVA
ncbi:MAG TPA: EAL domain-containing protein [Rhodocyclaceae bacterium]|nr:EAL domain-containing protein [Rhodocyclaceae bacterium]